jgi:RHS repeat-associated protein
MLAVKHFDPVVGIDVHIVLLPTPAGPIPTPLPTPFIGMVFDPVDYLPLVGATVKVNGLPRAHAGTGVFALPVHVPLAGPFLKPPGNEGEVFMGSTTVEADGEPMSFANVPVLTCQDLGVPPPPRSTKTRTARSLFLPNSVVIPIASGPLVLLGGAPTVSLAGLSAKALMGPLLKRLGKSLAKATKRLGQSERFGRKMLGASRYLNELADMVFEKLGQSKDSQARNEVSHLICTITGHPVDVATGKVFTHLVDLELLGPLPFKLERIWYSTSTYRGPLGHGWHASFDVALAEDERVVGVRHSDGRTLLFPALPRNSSHFSLEHRMTLHRDEHGYRLVEAGSGLTHHFARVASRSDLPRVKLTDRNGFAVHFTHDERGRLAEILDSGERSWQLIYGAGQRVARIEGPHPNHVGERVVYMRCSYDERGNLAEVLDAHAKPQRFRYDGHLLIKETNRNGLSFHFEYDGKDERARCLRTWGDDGIYDHKLSYDDTLGITSVTNSLGHKTQHEHDGAMVRRRFDAFGNKRETEYGAGYLVLSEVDEAGQRTDYSYDERGNVSRVVRPDGSSVSLRHDANDLPVEAIDALGGTWSWTREPGGRLLARTDPQGNTTRYRYSDRFLVSVHAPARTSLGYDERGNLTAIVAPDGGRTHFEHDLLGRVVSVMDAAGSVRRSEHDLLGRVIRCVEPDGNVRVLSHDGEGNVTRTKDRQHDVQFGYRGMNRLVSHSEAGTLVQFQYDTEEQLTAIINEHGSVYRFVLGPTGEVNEEHGFDGMVRRYTRDALGRVVRVDKPERHSEYMYDKAGRVTGVLHSDGEQENYAYRLDGALIEATNSTTSVQFERDALGRVISEKQGTHTVESEYDAQGLRVRMKSSLGASLAIERNVMGDVLQVASDNFSASFKRDQLGRELERTLPGGVRSRWQRDATGRPLQHTVTAGDHTLRAVGYQWDVNDRLRMLIDASDGPTHYQHDALGNLARASYPDGSSELRMPDAVGNLFRTEHRTDREYGRAGQLLVSHGPKGTTHYSYDREGNLTEKREPDGRTWRYEWNSAGMLARVTRPDGSAVTFAYDALARRVSKTYRGQTTRWVWDGNVPLHEWVEGELQSLAEANGIAWATADAETNAREAELERHLAQGASQRGSKIEPITWLFEPESFAPMARVVSESAQAIVCDHIGTPVLTVGADGNDARRASAATAGDTTRHQKSAALPCPFRFPGQQEDPETGLHYNRFRYFDPTDERYISRDPLGLDGGSAALYAYVHDPLAWADPLGLARTRGCGTDAPDGLLAGWKSRKRFGHAFLRHGQGAKISRSLMDRARGKGTPQGQWLDNETAAALLEFHRPGIEGPVCIEIPAGLGQVIMPNGTVAPAARALLAPGPDGYVSAFPIP